MFRAITNFVFYLSFDNITSNKRFRWASRVTTFGELEIHSHVHTGRWMSIAFLDDFRTEALDKNINVGYAQQIFHVPLRNYRIDKTINASK